MRYCTFIFSMSCSIASVTSYLSGIEAKDLQNGDFHVAQIPDFEMEYLENHLAHWGRWWLVFLHFHALSFELNFFFDRRFPLRWTKDAISFSLALLLALWGRVVVEYVSLPLGMLSLVTVVKILALHLHWCRP